jgi:hypothetical protein
MRRVLAWFLGHDGDCPACGGGLVAHEAGHHICGECGVCVDFDRGFWLYEYGHVPRRLPGILGLPFDRELRRAEDEAA